MTEEHATAVTPEQLAGIGQGAVAYMREFVAEDLKGKFPDLPELEPGTKLWALFAANGQPILLADERANALAGAAQNELTTVSLH